MKKIPIQKVICLTGWIIILSLLANCISAPSLPGANSVAEVSSDAEGLSADEMGTLNSLRKLDDHPLYSMQYIGAYPQASLPLTIHQNFEIIGAYFASQPGWGCALFAALGDPGTRLYGRNFDWNHSPALLLFTDPLDGYASVSMADIENLGFTGEAAGDLLDLPLSERKALLDAPSLPFDGMNERGLAIGMAAVPPGGMVPDPAKQTIGELGTIREILDHAATIDAALEIFNRYNIEMGEVPLHYLVASTAGESALVEFYRGEMVVFRNDQPWQMATNFIVAATDGQPQGNCPRYDRISERLQEAGGKLSVQEALGLLDGVSQGWAQAQSSTQWSIVYSLTSGEIQVVMGRNYEPGGHNFVLKLGN